MKASVLTDTKIFYEVHLVLLDLFKRQGPRGILFLIDWNLTSSRFTLTQPIKVSRASMSTL